MSGMSMGTGGEEVLVREWLQKDRTHSDTTRGRDGRNGAAGLPQSVSEHYEMGGSEDGGEGEFSERDG